MPKEIKLAIADDHKLLRKALVQMLQGFNYRIVAEADHGKELIEKLAGRKVDVVLMDINMPIMDGMETTRWFQKNHPETRVIALSMNSDESTIIRMIRAGAKGYLLKDTDPRELQKAIDEVIEKGIYYSDLIAGPLVQTLNNPTGKGETKSEQLTEKERVFLRHVCSELNYKEIAELMNVSARTVDGYRDELFHKLNVKTRVGLVLYAIKHEVFVPL